MTCASSCLLCYYNLPHAHEHAYITTEPHHSSMPNRKDKREKKGVTDGKLRQEPFYETDAQHTYLYGGSLPLEKKKVCFFLTYPISHKGKVV